MGPTAVHLQDGNLHNTKEATTGYPGEGARKNFERNKFLFKNGKYLQPSSMYIFSYR